MACSSEPVSFAFSVSAMDLAISLSMAKTSVSLRSKVSAQRWESLAALISCTFTRTASPLFCTASFQDVGNTKLLRYLGQIFRRAFVMLRRCPRDHLQIGD